MEHLVFDHSSISLIAKTIRHHLADGLIPFWLEHSWDTRRGGYLTNFDERGLDIGTPERYLNTQARLIWWFSTLYRHCPDQSDARLLAEKGVSYLVHNFWDSDFGGWYWKIRQDGETLDAGKSVYGQSFAIYALSEYFLATGDQQVLGYAVQTYDLLQTRCADSTNGGYFENMQRDWTLSPSGAAGGDRKSLDTHMHLMESFTALLAASGDTTHREKLLALIDLIAQRMVDRVRGCGINHFDVLLNPITPIALNRTWNAERKGDAPLMPADATSFGHNVEFIWLLRRALDVANADITPYRPLLLRFAEHAYTFGVDWDYGGVYRDGTADGQILNSEKEFWQHAEVLVGFLDAFEMFEDIRFWDAFVNVWTFVSRFMINHEVGEWRILLDRQGQALDPHVGNPWKVAYHTGRSMLECSQRLARLEQRLAP